MIVEQLKDLLDEQQKQMAYRILAHDSSLSLNKLVKTQSLLQQLISEGVFIDDDGVITNKANINHEDKTKANVEDNFLTLLNNKDALQHAPKIYEGYFHTSMNGGKIEANDKIIELNEQFVHTNLLKHDDKVQYRENPDGSITIVDIYHPENPRPNRYQDIQGKVKESNNQLYFDCDLDGQALKDISPFERYNVPSYYIDVANVKPDDILTVRYSKHASVPHLRAVWTTYGPHHFDR